MRFSALRDLLPFNHSLALCELRTECHVMKKVPHHSGGSGLGAFTLPWMSEPGREGRTRVAMSIGRVEGVLLLVLYAALGLAGGTSHFTF